MEKPIPQEISEKSDEITVEELKRELELSRKNNDYFGEKMIDLEKQLAEAKETIFRFEKQRDAYVSGIDELTTQLGDEKKQTEHYRKVSESLHADLGVVVEETGMLKEKIQIQEERITSLHIDLMQTKEQLQTTKDARNKLAIDIQDLKESAESEKQTLLSEIKSFRSDLDIAQLKAIDFVEQQTKTVDEFKAKHKFLQTEIEKLEFARKKDAETIKIWTERSVKEWSNKKTPAKAFHGEYEIIDEDGVKYAYVTTTEYIYLVGKFDKTKYLPLTCEKFLSLSKKYEGRDIDKYAFSVSDYEMYDIFLVENFTPKCDLVFCAFDKLSDNIKNSLKLQFIDTVGFENGFVMALPIYFRAEFDAMVMKNTLNIELITKEEFNLLIGNSKNGITLHCDHKDCDNKGINQFHKKALCDTHFDEFVVTEIAKRSSNELKKNQYASSPAEPLEQKEEKITKSTPKVYIIHEYGPKNGALFCYKDYKLPSKVRYASSSDGINYFTQHNPSLFFYKKENSDDVLKLFDNNDVIYKKISKKRYLLEFMEYDLKINLVEGVAYIDPPIGKWGNRKRIYIGKYDIRKNKVAYSDIKKGTKQRSGKSGMGYFSYSSYTQKIHDELIKYLKIDQKKVDFLKNMIVSSDSSDDE